jgi:predicted DNA-binding transcriptional regulator AlpA
MLFDEHTVLAMTTPRTEDAQTSRTKDAKTPRTEDAKSFHVRLNQVRQFLAAVSANCTEDEARAAFLSARRLCLDDDPDEDELISVAEASRLVGVHPQTARRWWKVGLFPKPRRLGPNRIGLAKSEVLLWIASRPRVSGQEEAA